MESNHDLVLRFMIALASNSKIHDRTSVKSEFHYDDLAYDAVELTKAFKRIKGTIND